MSANDELSLELTIGAWAFFNPHPKKQNVGDCVKRALVKVASFGSEPLSYKEVQDGLNSVKNLVGAKQFNNPRTLQELLVRAEADRITIGPGSMKCDIGTFALVHPEGVYIAASKSHWVAIVNGVLYDSYDSRDKAVVSAYQIDSDLIAKAIRSAVCEWKAAKSAKTRTAS